MTKQLPDLRGRPITWAQVSLEAMGHLADLMDRNHNAAKLILKLMRHMDDSGTGGGVVLMSRQTIAEILNCSLPTVDRTLKVLYTEGWVQRIRVGGASALAINSRVAWTNKREKLAYAIFTATVIASRSEQDAIALAPPPPKELPRIGRDELTLVAGGTGQPDLEGIPPLTEADQ